MLKDAFRQSSVSLVASERHGFIRFQYKSAKAVISFKSHGADAFFDRFHRGLLKSRSLIVIRPEPYSAPALGSCCTTCTGMLQTGFRSRSIWLEPVPLCVPGSQEPAPK